MAKENQPVEKEERAENKSSLKDTVEARAAETVQENPVEKEGKPSASKEARSGKREQQKRTANNVRRFRMERMISKAELARRAGVSPLTVDRVERGLNCRMDTKRKILEALGLQPSDRKLVFPKDD
jgi:DNA-binding XRE family transcriptional regulator